jgi:hypothetical protein
MSSKLKKYLKESILAGIARVQEDEDDVEEVPSQSDNYFAPEKDEQDWEKEPETTQLGDKSANDLYAKQEQLQQLLDKKDAFLMQLRSGQMGMDAYRDAIGNIPQQIKKLRDQIAAETTPEPELDDTEEIN